MGNCRIIDVHTHFTTPKYIKFLEDHDAFWEDGFPIPDWDVKDLINFMDESEIGYAMLSISSPHPYFTGYDTESIDMCRELNDTAASVMARYPGRFGFTATLPLPNVDAATDEAIRCLGELGAKGIKFGSNSRGLYIGDLKLEPLMEEINKLGAVCTIHPHRPEPMNKSVFSADPIPMYEFLADTTRAVINMIANGVIHKYSNVKWIVPHNGSFLPNIYPRFLTIFDILKAKGKQLPYIDVKTDMGMLYYDTAGHPLHLLKFLLGITDPAHILYGTDSPFTPYTYIKSGLDDLINLLETDEELKPYKQMILHDNAAELLNI